MPSFSFDFLLGPARLRTRQLPTMYAVRILPVAQGMALFAFAQSRTSLALGVEWPSIKLRCFGPPRHDSSGASAKTLLTLPQSLFLPCPTPKVPAIRTMYHT